MSLGKRAVEIVKHIMCSYKLQLLKRRLSEHAKHASSDADGFTIKPIPKLTAGLDFFASVRSRARPASPTSVGHLFGQAKKVEACFLVQAKKGEIVMLVKQR